jgi:hypothetical protein
MERTQQKSTKEKMIAWLKRWRGFILTVLWFVMFIWQAGMSWEGIIDLQFDGFKALSLNEKGDFLAGLFAPVAFLWLVLGYRQQGKELQQNTEALRMQAEELQHTRKAVELQTQELQKSVEAQQQQALAVQANTNHAAMQSFLMLEQQLVKGLEWNLQVLLSSHERFQQVFDDNCVRLLGRRPNMNDINLFQVIHFLKDGFTERLEPDERISPQLNWGIFIESELPNYKADIKYVKYYCHTFEMLIDAAKDVAEKTGDTRLIDYHQQSPAGELYHIFKNLIKEVEEYLTSSSVT